MEKIKYTACLETAVLMQKRAISSYGGRKWFPLFYQLYNCFYYKLLEQNGSIMYDKRKFLLCENGDRKDVLLNTYESLMYEFTCLAGWHITEHKISCKSGSVDRTIFSLEDLIIRKMDENGYCEDEAIFYSFHHPRLDFLLSEMSPLPAYEKKELLEQMKWYINHIYIGSWGIECYDGKVCGILVPDDDNVAMQISPILPIYCDEFQKIMERYQNEYV